MAEQMIILENKDIKVTISALGAEIVSVLKDGRERIWCGDPDVWAMHAPVMFPICGGLKDDKLIYDGKEYTLGKHGFARFMEFEVEYHDSEKAVFLLHSNEETLKQYPFVFEFRVIYTLIKSKVRVEYCTTNTGNVDMYFSAGAHEGYACPEGIEEYSIVFEKEENLVSNVLEGNLLGYNTVNVGSNTNELQLKYEYFAVDALVFLNLKSKKVWLKNNRTVETTEISFEGAPYLLLWTKPNAKYICVEPWFGISDFVDSDCDFVNKKGITKLIPGEKCYNTHFIWF